jgi:hypothetical protein
MLLLLFVMMTNKQNSKKVTNIHETIKTSKNSYIKMNDKNQYCFNTIFFCFLMMKKVFLQFVV